MTHSADAPCTARTALADAPRAPSLLFDVLAIIGEVAPGALPSIEPLLDAAGGRR